jgi:aspartyl-tRNA(Asn)/glutamyl-tRNA(Gln) amidotransferase subunit C
VKLSTADVAKIAALARLELSEAETETYREQLSHILDYIDKLNELDTSQVTPTAQVTGLTNRLDEDTVAPSSVGLPADVPATDGTSIKVRAVFSEEGS